MDAEIILLAAGRSSRTKIPKGLITVQGKPWINRQAQALLLLKPKTLHVVFGFHSDKYIEALGKLAKQCALWLNPYPEDGPFSSLKIGLSNCHSPAFVLPLDVPAALPKTWSVLLQSLGAYAAVVPTYDGQGGHPVLLSARFQKTLLSIPTLERAARLDHQLQKLDPALLLRLACQDPDVIENRNFESDFKTHSIPVRRNPGSPQVGI